ncbi:MAG: hypothetical protein QM499_07180 [Flavobacteriaceae bacterium]
MKNLILNLFFIALTINLVNAQSGWSKRDVVHQKNDINIGLGLNIVADSGLGFEELFNASDNWNFGNPFALSVEYYFNNKISIATVFSLNKYKEGKNIDSGIILKDNEATYFASDVIAKYSFRELLKLNRLEPYVFLGLGYTNIGEHKVIYEETQIELSKPAVSTMTTNIGLGLNYWFSERFAFYVNAQGKFGLSSEATNQIQYSFGGTYTLNN